MEKVFYIEEYSKNIPLFLTKNETGFIHSVFNNGINVKLGERLLFIGTVKNGRLPFGAHLSKELFEQFQIGIDTDAIVHWNNQEQSLTFNHGNIILSFEKAVTFDNQIHVYSEMDEICQNIETVLISLLDHDTVTGLDIPIEQFVLDYLQEKTTSDAIEEILFSQVTKLTDALLIEDKEACTKALRFMLGRGKGLTPSGDDHIVGLLAVQVVGRPFHSTFNEVVLSLVKNESITTDVAKEYLYYAANGQFSSTVVDVMEHLVDKTDALPNKLENLLAVGHCSGVDTIFGVLLGLLAWRRK